MIYDRKIEKGVNEFELIPQTQLTLLSGVPITARSTLANVSVEICSEACLLTDAFVCRSFDFFLDSNSCYLYTQNIVDKFDETVFKFTKNNNSNHYSSKHKIK